MITYIAVEELYPHKDNPRKDLGDLEELADSILANGILQNLTVVPGHYITDEEFPVLNDEYRRHPSERLRQIINNGESPDGYTVIIGHRRLAAAKLAGLEEVPCVVTRMTEKEQLSTMLTENMQRSDLTVYEQAQGFQMMIDLGETVESISGRSGFSKTTVRKRLKMAELDQSLLKEVSQRQVSLLDFDRLAQIEDLNVRNKCLKDIGTGNFKFAVAREIRRQAVNKQLPEIKKLMRKNHVNSINQSETWGGKYTQEAVFDLTVGDNIDLPKTDKPLFYCVDESYGELRLYTKQPKAKPVKRSQEEIDEEKRIAAAWDLKKEISAVMHKLRADFIQGLSITAKNKDMILQGAVIANVIRTVGYISTDRNGTLELLGFEGNSYSLSIVEAAKAVQEKDYPMLIYMSFGDSDELNFVQGWQCEYPKYDLCPRLAVLYDWLVSLGYEMSDEEKAMRDGTHELFSEMK